MSKRSIRGPKRVTVKNNNLGRWPVFVSAFLFVLALSMLCSAPAMADKQKRAAMVMDANTGRILYNNAGEKPRHPASLTKMMTIYLAFDLMKRGRLKENTLIEISDKAAAQPPSKLGLEPGSKIKLIHAIKALVTKSANDIAVAIAEHIAGTEKNFARLMTRKARSLGMKKTFFVNASGLPDERQVTTAHDMLMLALALQDDFPHRYRLFKTRHFTYRGKTYKNHNTLLGRLKGIDGIKTGYIRASGFNLVTSMHRHGKHIVAAVFGGKTARKRNIRMRGLLKRYLRHASTKRTRRIRPHLIASPHRVAPKARKLRTATAHTQPRRLKPAINPSRQAKVERRPTPRPSARQRTNTYPKPKIKMAKVRRVDVIKRPNTPVRHVALAPPPSTAPSSTIRAAYQPALYHGNETRRGRAPSTFNDQVADLIRRNKFSPGPKLAPPAAQQQTFGQSISVAPPPLETGTINGFQIQIGAYKTPSEAQQRLASVEQKTAGLLKGYQPLTQPVTSGQRTLYRARFTGFIAASSAKKACRELKKRAIDCLVTR